MKEASQITGVPNWVKEIISDSAIDTQLISPLAGGYHHAVYLYTPMGGSPKVIKLPRILHVFGIVHTAQAERENAAIIEEVFREFSTSHNSA